MTVLELIKIMIQRKARKISRPLRFRKSLQRIPRPTHMRIAPTIILSDILSMVMHAFNRGVSSAHDALSDIIEAMFEMFGEIEFVGELRHLRADHWVEEKTVECCS